MHTSSRGFTLLSLFFISLFILQSCAKEEAIPEPIVETPFKLYLTDCPFEADEVNVEITGVILEDKDGNKETLFTNSGVFNLLNFTDGIDTLLASGNIQITSIKHIYIELGSNNTIVVDGTTFPLQLVEDNIVKINVDLDRIDQIEFLVDFFACTSIIERADGFFLKPVIKFIGDRESDNELVEDLLESFEKCYSLVFPLSLLDKNGATLTANDRLELIEILINNEIKDAVFPINLLDLNGQPTQINSLEDARIIKDCDLLDEEEEEEEEEEESNELQELISKLDECYDIVFPISLIDDNASTHEVNDITELLIIFENNTIEDVILPIQLIDNNGATITIMDPVQIALLDLDC